MTDDHSDLSCGMAESSECSTRRLPSDLNPCSTCHKHGSLLLLLLLLLFGRSKAAETSGGVAITIASKLSQSPQPLSCSAGSALSGLLPPRRTAAT